MTRDASIALLLCALLAACADQPKTGAEDVKHLQQLGIVRILGTHADTFGIFGIGSNYFTGVWTLDGKQPQEPTDVHTTPGPHHIEATCMREFMYGGIGVPVTQDLGQVTLEAGHVYRIAPKDVLMGLEPFCTPKLEDVTEAMAPAIIPFAPAPATLAAPAAATSTH